MQNQKWMKFSGKKRGKNWVKYTPRWGWRWVDHLQREESKDGQGGKNNSTSPIFVEEGQSTILDLHFTSEFVVDEFVDNARGSLTSPPSRRSTRGNSYDLSASDSDDISDQITRICAEVICLQPAKILIPWTDAECVGEDELWGPIRVDT